MVAAFVAGVAALFAPCCITVLLPSYLGNVFRERYKIFFMTFVFFLGIVTVFLPIGLGASALAQVFSRYHNVIFAIGGVFLVILGLSMVFGKKFATPASVREGMKRHTKSVYFLGIFSAIATTCCAPVLAGVLALSVVSGSIVWGFLYTLAYVVGMTLPLFIIAAFLDHANLTEKFSRAKKTVNLALGARAWTITVSELVSSLVFVVMGAYITYLSFTNGLFTHSDYQLSMNIYNAKFINFIDDFTKVIPEYAWAALLVGVVSYVTYIFIKLQKKQNNHE